MKQLLHALKSKTHINQTTLSSSTGISAMIIVIIASSFVISIIPAIASPSIITIISPVIKTIIPSAVIVKMIVVETTLSLPESVIPLIIVIVAAVLLPVHIVLQVRLVPVYGYFITPVQIIITILHRKL